MKQFILVENTLWEILGHLIRRHKISSYILYNLYIYIFIRLGGLVPQRMQSWPPGWWQKHVDIGEFGDSNRPTFSFCHDCILGRGHTHVYIYIYIWYTLLQIYMGSLKKVRSQVLALPRLQRKKSCGQSCFPGRDEGCHKFQVHRELGREAKRPPKNCRLVNQMVVEF